MSEDIIQIQEKEQNRKLTLKERIFCEKYMATAPLFDGKKAALAAGYTQQKATKVYRKLIEDPAVQDYIEQLRAEARLRNGIELDDIINEYAKIAFFDIRTIYNPDGTLKSIHSLDAIGAASVCAIETDDLFEFVGKEKIKIGETKRVKIRDKLAALDKLRECLGMVPKTGRIIRDADGKLIATEEDITMLPIVFK